jgi:hypothetical protein
MKRRSVKRFLKIEAMKCLTLHRLASSLTTLCEFMHKSPFNSGELSNTYVNAKTTKFFGFVTENRKYNDFFLNWQSKSLLHRFNVNYGKNIKSDEAMNRLSWQRN